MKTKLSLIAFIFFFLAGNYLSAQVTIGKLTPPEDFSILQIERSEISTEPKGVRLPQSSSNDKTAIDVEGKPAAEKVQASGLVIYNKTTNQMEFWNGTDWIQLNKKGSIQVDASNGVTMGGNTVNLGGALTKATTIGVGAQTLSFSGDAGSKFDVHDNAFTVADNKVGFGTDNPTAAVHVKSTTAGNGFRLEDGSQASNNVLASDADGNAVWAPLKPFQSVSIGTVYGQGQVVPGMGTYGGHSVFPRFSGLPSGTAIVKVSNKPVTLYPGKWLIFAKIATKESKGSGDANSYIQWLYLRNDKTNVDYVTTTMYPENSGFKLATPIITSYVEVTETTTFSLHAARNSGAGNLQIHLFDDFGKSFFYAIRIDANE